MTFGLIIASCTFAHADEITGLRVPDGFVVTEFSGSDLANDIQCMTIDPRGRVIVSGRGYTKILLDDDGDGIADRALPFADGPKDGAMGLWWEGDSLFVVGDGGLRRYVDTNDDGIADGPSDLILPLVTGSEHDAHAVRRGPDGWLYVMVGNFASVDSTYASLPTTPIADPVAGCLLRLPPDLTGCEIVADGFRNAYDFDFGSDGEVFTYDSDNERCVSLPWYEPTRFYHVVPGGNHGWLGPQQTDLWRLPPEMEDVVPPVASLDRGSPTGVVCYKHHSFPEGYHGGFFLLDWTFGRVYFLKPERAGASYSAQPEIFLEATGTQGFAWTDADIHPTTGDLYLSIGGRGTRGAVYRVRYEGSRIHERVSGLESRLGDHASDPLPGGAIDHSVATDRLLDLSSDPDALQRLRALIALKRVQSSLSPADLLKAIRPNLDHSDRLVRKATADLIGGLDAEARASLADLALEPRARLTLGFGIADDEPAKALAIAAAILDRPDSTPDLLLATARLVQVSLGRQPAPDLKATVWEGYSAPRDSATSGNPSAIDRISEALIHLPPTGLAAFERERARTLAMLAVASPAAIGLVTRRLTESSDPIDDLHHLIVLGRLPGDRSEPVTRATADALLALDLKLDRRGARRDRNWPLRVSELVRGLADHDPTLLDVLVTDPEFGRPDHAIFARTEGFDLVAASDQFLDRGLADPEFNWNAEVLTVLASRPTDRTRSALRALGKSRGFEELILTVLASGPIPNDRPRFVSGLRSTQASTLKASLDALEHLGPIADPDEQLALILALRRSNNEAIRPRIARVLANSSQQSFGDDPDAWASWFSSRFPDRAGALEGGDGVDAQGWARRLSAIDWDRGDASRGQPLFARAQCSACHAGNLAVGPDLSGIGGRFSREDLFTAIIQPSKDIADRYRSLVVATNDGAIYEGIAIYDAVDSLILQTGSIETMFLRGESIEERRVSDLSLMPAGLIDEFTDQEIADLDAYLRSL